jgi:WD40 repeat protein
MVNSDRSDVFLSYRRKDVDFVKQVDQALKAAGREVWVDWEDIPPGVEGFTNEIQRGIEGADAFIAILSPNYLESDYCIMELKEALRLKKRVIPLVHSKFDPAPPPEGIGHINWVYFTPHAGQANTFEEAFPRVIHALEADYDHARNHTQLLLRAIEWEKHQRNAGYLLKGAAIDAAESWQVAASSKTPTPTELQGEYILTSRQQQRQQQQRIMGAIGVLLVIAAIAAVLAVLQANEARRQEALAVAAQAEALKSAEIAHSNALASAALEPGVEDIAVALALEATRSQFAPPEVFKALEAVAYPPGSIRALLPPATDEFYEDFLYPAVSPDGRFMVRKKHLYDLTTGELVREFENTPGYVLSGVFTADGTQVILAGDDDGVLDPAANPVLMGLYDVATGKLVQQYDTGIGVMNIQLSGDGSTVISYQPDGTAVWWDVSSGDKLREFVVSKPAIFSPDLNWLAEIQPAVEGLSGELVLTDTKTMEVKRRFVVVTYFFNDGVLRFSPDSTEITVAADEVVQYTVPDGQILTRFKGSSGRIITIRYSPDGQTVLMAATDSTASLWDHNGTLIARQTAHRSGLLFADFVHAGERAVSMDIYGMVMLWDIQPGNVAQRLPNITPLGLAPDMSYGIGTEYIDEGWDVVTFDMATLAETARLPVLAAPVAAFVANDPNQSKFVYTVTKTDDQFVPISGTIAVADLTSGDILSERTTAGLFSNAMNFLPDGQRILMNYVLFEEDYVTHTDLWDVSSNALVREFVPPLPWQSAALSPDGSRLLLATGESDPEHIELTQMIDVASGETLFSLDDEYLAPVWFTPDGTQFIDATTASIGGTDTLLTFRDSQTGAIIREMPLKTQLPTLLVFHPDGHSFFTGIRSGGTGTGANLPSGIDLTYSVDNRQRISQWDTLTGNLIRDFPNESSDAIVLKPDGSGLLTFDRVWRLDTPEELIAWTCVNRYVADFTPEQRERYDITSDTSVCASGE